MDKIKLAAGIASAALLAGSVYTFFNMPVSASVTEEKSFYSIGKERSAEEVAEINALARMLYGEAKSVKSTTERAACVWVVLNRVDDSRWPDNVVDVLSQKWQFGGYSPDHPVETDLRILAADVYDRWTAEKAGADEGKVMRVVPSDYFFWRGDKTAEHNWFRKYFDDYRGETHSWGLASPYED